MVAKLGTAERNETMIETIGVVEILRWGIEPFPWDFARWCEMDCVHLQCVCVSYSKETGHLTHAEGSSSNVI